MRHASAVRLCRRHASKKTLGRLDVLFVRPKSAPLAMELAYDWESFDEHRDELLRVVDVEGIWRFVGCEVVIGHGAKGKMMASKVMTGPHYSTPNHLAKPSTSSNSSIIGDAWQAGSLPHEESEGARRTIVSALSNITQFRYLHTYLDQSGLAVGNGGRNGGGSEWHCRDGACVVPPGTLAFGAQQTAASGTT